MNKGFTLIELLATIVIMAIILLMVLPAITALQENNEERPYEYYGDSIEEEKDILAMIAGTVADQPNEWLAIEVYRNNEAYKQHLETKNFKEYLNNTKYCVESKSLRKLQPDVIVDQGAIFYQP